jgi:hypothetical protein
MSQRRSDAGSNKRVMVMLVLIVVMVGVYAALTFAPDTVRGLFAEESELDASPWETTADVTPAGATEASVDVATQQVVEETAALQEQLEREQETTAVGPAGDASATPAATLAVASAETQAPAGLDYSALDPSTREMMDLKRKLDLANTSLQVQQAQAAIEEARRQTEGVRLGTNAIPMLVGVSGSPSRGLRAEFHLGGSQRVALIPGRWMTPNWKLISVDAAGAEVQNAQGERTRLVLGTRPVQGATQPQQNLQLQPMQVPSNSVVPTVVPATGR